MEAYIFLTERHLKSNSKKEYERRTKHLWCDVKVAQHTVERPIHEITRNERIRFNLIFIYWRIFTNNNRANAYTVVKQLPKPPIKFGRNKHPTLNWYQIKGGQDSSNSEKPKTQILTLKSK